MTDTGGPVIDSKRILLGCWVEFLLIKHYPKTNEWSVNSKKSGIPIGDIAWNRGWRQYVFYPDGDTYYSAECLNDIAKFILMAEKQRREK